jgi:phage terminase large subunit-like protein
MRRHVQWWDSLPDPDADFRRPEVWREANPALDDFLYIDDFETSVRLTPENEFRTKRLNQWVSSASAWSPSQRSVAFSVWAGPVWRPTSTTM